VTDPGGDAEGERWRTGLERCRAGECCGAVRQHLPGCERRAASVARRVQAVQNLMEPQEVKRSRARRAGAITLGIVCFALGFLAASLWAALR
jgi:hypothetical protein